MADEKQPGKAQLFFAQHGEKLGLGIAVAILAVYVLFFVLMAKENTTARASNQRVQQIQSDLALEHKDKQPQDARPWQDDALDPWLKLPQVASAHDTAVAYYTKGEAKMVAAEVKAEKQVVMRKVKLDPPKVALGEVTVGWSLADLPKDAEEAVIEHFLLERRKKDAKWEPPVKVLGKNTSWIDNRVEPKSTYEYQLTPVTKHAKYVVAKGERGPLAGPVTAVTLGIFELRIVSAVPPTAYIEVIKFEIGKGKASIKKIYKPGDKIGSDPNTGSFKHRVYIEGSSATLEIDFNTGYELISVEEKKLDVERIVCKDLYAADGKRIGCKQTKENVPFTTTELAYTDDTGAEVKVFTREPKANDVLCVDHGGKATDTTPEEKKPEEKKPGEKKPEDAAKKREADAKGILQEADKLWSKDKGAAKALYKKLLGEYADTKIVKDNDKKIREREK